MDSTEYFQRDCGDRCGSGDVTFQLTRSITGLKEGGKVPGYVGHTPMMRFDYGKTYGEGTHKLYQLRKDGFTDPDVAEQVQRCHKHREASATQSGFTNRKGVPISAIPRSNGDNKYTQDMVPGYTGYIPRSPFKFGNPYKDECDICLSEHFSSLRRRRAQGDYEESLGNDSYGREGCGELQGSTRFRSLPNMTAVSGDPEVKDHLNAFTAGLASRKPRKGVYRPPFGDDEIELPIPGYKGFIPRVRTTEIGLGSRYTEQTKNGLDWFYDEHSRRAAMLKAGLAAMSGGGSGGNGTGSGSDENISIDKSPLGGHTCYAQYGCMRSSNSSGIGGSGKGYALASSYGTANGSRFGGQVCERREHCFGAANGLGGPCDTQTMKKSISFVA